MKKIMGKYGVKTGEFTRDKNIELVKELVENELGRGIMLIYFIIIVILAIELCVIIVAISGIVFE